MSGCEIIRAGEVSVHDADAFSVADGGAEVSLPGCSIDGRRLDESLL